MTLKQSSKKFLAGFGIICPHSGPNRETIVAKMDGELAIG